MSSIDLNADLGEGFGRWTLTDDERLLSVVTSANVACGFHAGDPVTMRRVCELAAERVPDRCPGGLRPRGGHARVVREAARRALQPRRARRGTGGGGRRRGASRRRHAARPRPARLASPRAGRRGGTARRHRGVRGPRVHRPGHAGAARPGRLRDHGRRRGGGTVGGPRHGRRGRVPLRRTRPRPGPLPVPARRHTGRGGAGPAGAGRSGGLRRVEAFS